MLSAAVTALVTWLVTPVFTPVDAYRAAREWVRPDPPPPTIAESIVNAYVRQTRDAVIWYRRPTVFPQGAGTMRTQFARFDPRRTHPYREAPFKLVVPTAVTKAPLLAGAPVEVFGRIVAANVLRALKPPLVEWVLQLAPMSNNTRGIVYCRVTAPLNRGFDAGQHWTASGTIIAVGGIALARGGFTHAAYLACSAVRRPKGDLGRLTRFIERTGLDFPSMVERSKNETEFLKLYRREIAAALENDPALADWLVREYSDP